MDLPNEYGIWLSFNNQENGFRLPVNPESIEVQRSGDAKSYQVQGLGEINVIKDPKLTQYNFSGIFPAQYYPFVLVDKLAAPPQYVRMIEQWMETNRPIRFVFTSKDFDINTPASIEKFDWKETAGGSGDIEYQLTLKRYVFYSAKKARKLDASEVQQAKENGLLQSGEGMRPDTRVIPWTLDVRNDDNVWLIAKKIYGDGSRYQELQSLNGLSDAEAKKLPAGFTLKLPEVGSVAGNSFW
ncbi:LysM peptidoglycan-binding domain-containing protein [Paenibacillus sp. y28]|uniref:LysM peptidoglycan-binding domain-containing protein n=1 Tax=Paenibacillus sp. y28 TaxID=3129110 RepID=UPI00301A6E57